MNSFYGGKQGRTYHLVARYDCVNIISFINEYKALHDEEQIESIDSIPQFDPNASYSIGEVFKNVEDSSTIFYLVIKDFQAQSDFSNYTTKIKAMVQQFQKGGAYTEVNYGQYVIIDTIKNRNHKSDLENGLLFRRGFDYNQKNYADKPDINSAEYYIQQGDTKTFDKEKWQAAWSGWVQNVGGGAIYVGQIVGPQGDAPQLFPIQWEQMIQLQDAQIRQANPVSNTEGFKWEYEEGYDQTSPDAEQHRSGVYDDTVKVATVTLKDSDGNIIGADIAFDIPAPTIKVSAQVVDAYGNNTRNHFDEASQIIDTNLDIQVNRDQNNKVIGYSKLIHQHTATGKKAVDENGEETPHPFYLNYDIAIPRGIHGDDIASVQLETGEKILENNEWQYDIKEWIYDVKEWQYEEKVEERQWEVKEWEYDPEYPQGTEDAEQHRIPIYWSEEDEGWEEHYTPVYWTDQDEGYQNHRTPLSYWTQNDQGYENHRTPVYWTDQDQGYEEHRHLIFNEDDIDANEERLVLDDKYITFSVRNYDIQAEGNIIDSHAGRFPYRVIDKIVKKFQDRDYFIEGTAKIGDLYLYQNASDEEYSYIAICLAGGTLPEGYDIFNQKENGDPRFSNNIPVPGTYFEKADNDCVWRVLKLPTQPAPYALTIDYQAGEDSEDINTNFIDYIYIDDTGHIHTVDSKKVDNTIGFINSVKSVSYDQGVFTFTFTDGRVTTSFVDIIVDIKRIGDNLAVLYSNQEKIAEERANGTPCYDLEYEGQMKIYKILANSMGNYHIQGKFNLIDLVKYTDPADGNEKEGILYNGIENYSPQELQPSGNEERAGWVVFTQVEKDGEDIITIYAYDYNRNNYGPNGEPPYTIDYIPYTWIEEREGEEPIEHTDDILTNCPTYWYPLETLSITSIDPSYIYIIDKEKENSVLPVPSDDTKAAKLNENGLWFVVSTGHDNY